MPKRKFTYMKKSSDFAKKRLTAPLRLKQMVNKEVSKTREKKTWYSSILDQHLTDYANVTVGSGFADSNVIPLAPTTSNTIDQGVGQSDRIGNKIRIKKAVLKYILIPTPYDNAGALQNLLPRPYDVRMFVLHSKQTPSEVIVGTDFFNINNGSVNPGDDLQDMVLDVNKDIYVVSRDIRHKLGYSNYGGTATSLHNQSYTNNDYKLNVMKTIDITSAFPVNMIFDDADDIPTSFNPSLVVLVAPADGEASTPDAYPVKIYTEMILTFTDA